MLTDPVATAFEKNVHGTSATEANNGYGTPPVSKSAAVLARIVNAPEQQQRREHRPGDADLGLLVAGPEVALGQRDDQLLRPHQLAEHRPDAEVATEQQLAGRAASASDRRPGGGSRRASTGGGTGSGRTGRAGSWAACDRAAARSVVVGRSRVVRWCPLVASPAARAPARLPRRPGGTVLACASDQRAVYGLPTASRQAASTSGACGNGRRNERMRARIGRQVTVADENGDQTGGHGGSPAPADPVLHVITSTQRRGAETFAVDLAAALGDRGVASEVAALAPGTGDTLDVATLGPSALGSGHAAGAAPASSGRSCGGRPRLAHAARLRAGAGRPADPGRVPQHRRSGGVGRRAACAACARGRCSVARRPSPPCGPRRPTPSTTSTACPALGCTSSPTASRPNGARSRTRRRGRRPAPTSACRPAAPVVADDRRAVGREAGGRRHRRGGGGGRRPPAGGGRRARAAGARAPGGRGPRRPGALRRGPAGPGRGAGRGRRGGVVQPYRGHAGRADRGGPVGPSRRGDRRRRGGADRAGRRDGAAGPPGRRERADRRSGAGAGRARRASGPPPAPTAWPTFEIGAVADGWADLLRTLGVAARVREG